MTTLEQKKYSLAYDISPECLWDMLTPRIEISTMPGGGEGCRVPQESLDHLMQSVGFRHAYRVKVTSPPPTRTEALLKRLGLAVVKTRATTQNLGARAEDVLEAELQLLGAQAKTRLTAGIVDDVLELIDACTPRDDSAWLDGANVKGLMRGLKRDIMEASGL